MNKKEKLHFQKYSYFVTTLDLTRKCVQRCETLLVIHRTASKFHKQNLENSNPR